MPTVKATDAEIADLLQRFPQATVAAPKFTGPADEFRPNSVEYCFVMPPTVNHYWRHVIIKGKPRIVLGSKGKKFREDVAKAVEGKARVADGRLKVVVKLHFSDKRRCDIANREKAMMDALTHCGAIADDSLIDDLQILRGQPWESACCFVYISVIGGGEREES